VLEYGLQGFRTAGSGFRGADMVCEACGSESLTQLQAEVTASFPHAEDVKLPPIYFSQQLRVCLNCGSAELRVPPAQLDALKMKKSLRS